MKFYGNGIVWDTKNNKILCEFVKGEFDAKDLRVINELKKLGYKSDKKEGGVNEPT